MAWLRVDDTFAEHRKMVQLERGERWTWMEVLLYCARQRNDGRVPVGISDVLRHVDDIFLAKCVQVGLLDRSRNGALKVHDWSVYNPKDRTAAERMARHRERNAAVTETEINRNENGASRAGTGAQPVPSPKDNPPLVPPQNEREESDDEERLEAWKRYAARQPEVRNRSAYARTGFNTGDWPPDPSENEPKRIDHGAVCDDCGETYGAGHLNDCPRLAKNRIEAHR